MNLFIQILFCATITLSFAAPLTKDDVNLPYEFGFTIDGQQHRHEQKDARGIIQGEFGFITADGVYHVTVYATDENGNFKILSMKNIRVSGPLDGSGGPPSGNPTAGFQSQPQAQPVPLQLPEQPQQPVTQPPSLQQSFTLPPTIKPACAGCGLVNRTEFKFQSPAFQNQNQGFNQGSNAGFGNQGLGGFPANQGANVGFDNGGNNNNYPGQYEQNQYQQGVGTPGQQQYQDNQYPQNQYDQNQYQQNYPGGFDAGQQQNYENSGFGNTGANDVNGLEPNPLHLPPVTVNDHEIQVGGDHPQTIPIRDKFPGMSPGLPEGIEEKDITDLLYKFHYTVGFHGHYEKGLKNGAKIGGYFVNGRDGVSRVVTYVADENGYRPKFKFVRLGLESEKTPKEATEKSFGLESFEFVWYPIE